MRILFLSPRECWPATTGARLRAYYLGRALSRGASVSLLAYSREADAEPREKSDETAFFEHIWRVPVPPRYTALKLIRGLTGRMPLSVVNYTSAPMTEALGRVLNEHAFDLVQVEGTQMASYAPMLNKARLRPLVAYNWHNIESELIARYGERAPSFARRFYARVTAARLRSLELRLLRDADAHLVCSNRERDILLEREPRANVLAVPNGVDVGYFSREVESDGTASPRRLVFVGSMDYVANVEAVAAFGREIWPSVRPYLPGCEFTIVGSNPAAEVRALAQLGGITVTGTVPDVRQFYRGALAAVVPIATAGGTRIKILEAMAAGVPVVSTPLGAEGLEVKNGENILFAQTASEWRDGLCSLAADADLRRRLITAGRSLVRARYDWDNLGGALLDWYHDLLSGRRPA